MSRCFPFPPPGYVVNGGGHDEAMIDSIKGAEEKCEKEHKRERKRAKKDKKDKRDRKDKEDKKDKKDKKRKEREIGVSESGKHSHKRRRKEEVAKDVQKNTKVDVVFRENDCFEKSSLTVERELVQSTSQNSCDSTLNSNEKEKQKVKQHPLNGRHNNNDGTLNSNELPKEKQLLDGRHNNNNDSESIIRIRLPIRRPKDPEVMMMMITNKDQHCPSRDIKLDSVTREQPQHPCSTSAPEHASKPHKEKRKEHTSTRKHKEKKMSSTTQVTYQPSSLCRLCPPSMAEQFLNVVENWVPNKVESIAELTNSEEDESWWLMKKPSNDKIDTERCKQVNRNNETKEVMSTWPRARFLPEADVYALPYTVPF